MSDSRPDIQEIFCGALDRESPAERRDFLDEACQGDAQLRAEVEQLLESHHEAGKFLKGYTRTGLCADTDEIGEDADGSRTAPHVDAIPLDFLDPPGQPGSIGRLGQYEILEAVGRGGMGIVLKAQDVKLNRVVAVKVLAPELASNPTARKRFLREAQAAAAVSHDHVVTIYAVDDGDGSEGLPYLVMEFIDGRSLQEKIDGQGTLELKEVLRIGRQIAAGLAAAHEQGLIHRDVKPSNILLQNGVQRVQITDFGLARAVDDVGITRTGEVTGTPQYMSPEQAQGQPVDARSDLFSLGSVLYAMCTGRSPFRAETTMAALRRVCDETPRPLREINSDVPEWLVAIIDRLLEKDADHRFQTAGQVADLLARHLAQLQDPGSTPFPGTAHRTTPGAGPRRRWLVVGLILLLAAAGFSLMEVSGVTHLSATLVRGVTGDRTPVVETDSDTRINVSRDREPVTIHTGADQPEVDPWPDDAPPRAIAPFDADQARVHQQAWADYLGLPVVKEITLGKSADGEDVTLAMVLIPPGEFLMGSSDDEIANLREQATATGLKPRDLDWIDLEGPQRPVFITRPLYLSRHEFTTGQFRRFVSDTGYETEAESSGRGAWKFNQHRMEMDPNHNWQFVGVPHAADKPVVNVTWNDANACCEWLSQQEPDLTFALPTEAQWEYACRAGTTTTWCSGEDSSQVKEYGWVAVNWIQRVGRKRPNAFGLYDMHGNVWEWCRDSFYNYRDAGGVDPVGPTGGATRIVRGGNCFGGRGDEWNNRSGCRSAARFEAIPEHRVFEHGFRVAAAITSPELSPFLETVLESDVQPSLRDLHPADAPSPAIAPFDADQAAQHQQAWADWLRVPVEQEIGLGQNDDGEDVTLPMVLIPPGEFTMGSSPEEINELLVLEDRLRIAESGEQEYESILSAGPQHRVTLTRPFRLSAHHVTQQQYERLTGRNPSYFSAAGGGNDLVRGEDSSQYPVEQISWFDAVAFCNQLSEREGLRPFYLREGDRVTILGGSGYRLPTEAEWEFACRAGTTTAWSFGDDRRLFGQHGWVWGVNVPGGPGGSWSCTRPVGLLKPNAFNLFDMHGNVFDWCQDWLGPYAEGRVSDPLGPAGGEARALRGGCYNNLDQASRSSQRSGEPPELVNAAYGFRVARTIESEPVHVPAGEQVEIPQPAPYQWPADAPPPAIAPFDAGQAAGHQQAWADYLGMPANTEIVVGQDEEGTDVTLIMVLIPPGEFLMGSTPEEQDRFSAQAAAANEGQALNHIPGEGPQHLVRITRPFYLGRHPVTQSQWQALMDNDPSEFHGNPSHPVEKVGRDDIESFLANLNQHASASNMRFALPTEAQWEYACRAGTTTSWHCGDSEKELLDCCWFRGYSGGATHPVGQLKPNGFGLYDMHGNVWEWCADWYAAHYYTRSPTDDPVGPASGWTGVLRGGSWGRGAWSCRSAARLSRTPDFPLGGFRLAAALPEDLLQTRSAVIDADVEPPAEDAPTATPQSASDVVPRVTLDFDERAAGGGSVSTNGRLRCARHSIGFRIPKRFAAAGPTG